MTKGIHTFPSADLGHRQLKPLFRQNIAFLFLGMLKSPSSRNSNDPFEGKMQESPTRVREYDRAKVPACTWSVLTVVHPEDGGGDVLVLRRLR